MPPACMFCRHHRARHLVQRTALNFPEHRHYITARFALEGETFGMDLARFCLRGWFSGFGMYGVVESGAVSWRHWPECCYAAGRREWGWPAIKNGKGVNPVHGAFLG